DGTVASWGLNTNGQLGNNSTTQSTVPVAVITSGILSGKSVVAIASGNYHNVVACSDGTVATWGYNFNGQLGNNSTTNSSVPVAVVTSGTPLAGKAVITVSAGYGHCLALCSDGTVAAWGYGIFGQLGNNGTTQSTVPVAVTTSGTLSGRTVIAISAGYYHNLALCADGTLVAWGYGPNGELGTTSSSSYAPALVDRTALTTGEQFVQASSMSVAHHCLSIIAKPAPAPAIYVQQSAGADLISNSSSVDCGSSVVSAGVTQTLTLGNSGSADLLISGVTIDGVNAADFAITTAPAGTVAAGGTTTLVLTFAPGAAFGRTAALHVTTNDPLGSPFNLSLTGSGRAAVSATYSSDADVPVTTSSFNASGSTVNFTLGYTPVPGTTLMVVKNTGLAFISGTFGNLSQGQAVSLKYNGITYSFVASYYGGTGNDLVLVWAGSRPMAWGNNNNGQLGNNNKTNSSVPVALTTAGTPLAGRTLLALSAGYQHSLALCSDGTLAAWGDNAAGELGTNTNTGSSVPVAVTTAGTPLAGKVAVAVSAGWQHNLVLCADGTLTAWGSNSSGQLGNNSTTNSLVPVAVTTIGTPLAGRAVVAIRTGASHNLALCADGTLATWGNNYYGQLGNNSTTSSLVPVAVTTAGTPLAGKSVVSFAAGATHNIALCSDGTLVTWGYNSFGQLGNNSFTQSNIPVTVITAGTVLAGKTVIGVAAGSYCSLALCSDGTVASWGSNINGQLGNNSTNDTKLPVGVITSGVLAGKTLVGLMAGGTHSLALCSDGMVAAWGDNTYYQLGNGTTSSNSSTPVAVSTSSLAMGERFMQLVSGSNSGHSLGLVASPAPNAATLASTSITATSASLNGTVNANGAAATVSFDYGLDDTYGTNVAGAPASITGADDTAVSTTLTGLAPNTTYHFRVNGSNGSGSANGADLTFTTPPLSPLQNWRQTNFGTLANSGSTADAADYDGDSIPNLIEYALNLSPTVTSKLPLATALSGANFEYTYSRSTAAVNAGTTFAVEWSGTLTATWSRSGVTQTVLSDDGTTQQVKAVIPVNAATTMFMRLSVTAPP
ncbi:MAG: choice-of-anchor D domain-containing protein, partial [Prosthecobacter sp.]|uniref:RCC1 domain-containing protein n=1 Tax=Prosthecobacter sp. TaxID=1965333 RepID=UPI003BAF83FA